MNIRLIISMVVYFITKEVEVFQYSSRSCAELLEYSHCLDLTLQDGAYNVTIEGDVMPVYCDMTTDGGGWTLLVAMVEGTGWTLQNILSRNEFSQGLSNDYSILGKADHIKAVAEGETFQYALEATGRGKWGGRFSAPISYSLVHYNPDQTNIRVIAKYDNSEFGNYSLGKRLPWIDLSHDCAMLSTKSSASPWWGSLVMRQCDRKWSSLGPSAWLKSGSLTLSKTKPIYYWLRENALEKLFPASKAGAARRMTCNDVSRLVDGVIQTGLTLPGQVGPGCVASFSINTTRNDTINKKYHIKIVGENLAHENVIVSHGNGDSQAQGLFELCQLSKRVNQISEKDVLYFICDIIPQSVLHLVMFTEEAEIRVDEVKAIGMK